MLSLSLLPIIFITLVSSAPFDRSTIWYQPARQGPTSNSNLIPLTETHNDARPVDGYLFQQGQPSQTMEAPRRAPPKNAMEMPSPTQNADSNHVGEEYFVLNREANDIDWMARADAVIESLKTTANEVKSELSPKIQRDFDHFQDRLTTLMGYFLDGVYQRTKLSVGDAMDRQKGDLTKMLTNGKIDYFVR